MLRYSVSGPPNGIPVIFLHAVGIDSWMWKNILPYLPEVRAIAIDLPGHGDSRDVEWVSLEQTAELVRDVVNKMCPTGAHFAAVSLGSYVGFHVLALQPKAHRTALLSGIHGGGMPRKWLMYLMSLGIAPLATRPTFALKTASMFGLAGSDRDEFVRHATQTRPSAFRRGTNDVVAFELPPNSKDIDTRIMFAAGSKEHELILKSLNIFVDAVPNGEKILIDGGGHGWLGTMPELFAKTLRTQITGAN